MSTLLAIAIGGAIGSVLRYVISTEVQRFIRIEFPYGVLLVNVLGCFLVGLLATLFIERIEVLPLWRAAILIGFLGGFTTFSTFTNDTINMLQVGEVISALLYIMLSVILCLTGTWVGVLLARSH
jgi:CrcB protein